MKIRRAAILFFGVGVSFQIPHKLLILKLDLVGSKIRQGPEGEGRRQLPARFSARAWVRQVYTVRLRMPGR
jgi:hypothetical protein